jgi:hypothetical protein
MCLASAKPGTYSVVVAWPAYLLPSKPVMTGSLQMDIPGTLMMSGWAHVQAPKPLMSTVRSQLTHVWMAGSGSFQQLQVDGIMTYEMHCSALSVFSAPVSSQIQPGLTVVSVFGSNGSAVLS